MYDDLIARLRVQHGNKHALEAADALEAQARRIAELEAQWSQDVMFENCEYRSEAGWDRLRARIAALEAQILELEDMLVCTSTGVQSCRTDINMAVVWLPAIQRIREYLRAKDENEEAARAALEKKND